MPIYEYYCQDCKKEFEELIFGNDATVVCKYCQSANIEKLLSAVSFKSGSTFTPASGTAGCSSCSGKTCSTCK